MKVKCIIGYTISHYKRSVLSEKRWINQRAYYMDKYKDPEYVYNLFKNTYEDYLAFFRFKNKINCTVGFVYEVIRLDKAGRYFIKCDNGKVEQKSPANFIKC